VDAVLEEAAAAGMAIGAVGHRVVHGGPRYGAPARVTPELLDELRRVSPFDPEHLPEQIRLMEELARRSPGRPQVACFDTAFHRDLPRVSRILPIPRSYEALGLRKYGFHGLSFESLVEQMRREPGGLPSRLVLAHLGNGASLAAVLDGRGIDTTMSFTPASGIPMSRRSGDLDPGLAAYLSAAEGMTPDRFNEMVNTRSGLLGISEISGDVRVLLERERQDVRAAEALAVFCYRVKTAIGALAAALGGLDALVFSGGIGENSAEIRSRVCAGLEFLGISASGGRVPVRVLRADEEARIAAATRDVLNGGG
jgi:acetate kinase